MNTRTEHPLKKVIDASYTEVVTKGTDGASDKAVIIAAIGYLAEMFGTNRRPRTRREYITMGLDKGGPWAVAATLVVYVLNGILGG